MGRAKKYEGGVIVRTFSFPADMDEVLEDLKVEASKRGMSLSEYVAYILREARDRNIELTPEVVRVKAKYTAEEIEQMINYAETKLLTKEVVAKEDILKFMEALAIQVERLKRLGVGSYTDVIDKAMQLLKRLEKKYDSITKESEEEARMEQLRDFIKRMG